MAQRLAVAAALAADHRRQQPGQAVAADALGQFGVGEGERLLQGIGEWRVGTRTSFATRWVG